MAAERDLHARELALEALAAGVSQSEAARRADVSRMAIHRWLKEPEFAAALELRKAERATAPVNADEQLALETLRSVAKGELEGDAKDLAVRVAASRALLGHVAAKRRPSKPGQVAAPAPKVLNLQGGAAAASEWLKKA